MLTARGSVVITTAVMRRERVVMLLSLAECQAPAVDERVQPRLRAQRQSIMPGDDSVNMMLSYCYCHEDADNA